MRILTDVQNMLHVLVKRVEGTEKEVKKLKQSVNTPSSSDSSSKRKIPPLVRVSTNLLVTVYLSIYAGMYG